MNGGRSLHWLRATCQSELTARFPEPAVNEWLGNSLDVARAHYLQTLSRHVAETSTEGVCAVTRALGAESEKNVQNTCSTDSQGVALIADSATGCEKVRLEAKSKAPRKEPSSLAFSVLRIAEVESAQRFCDLKLLSVGWDRKQRFREAKKSAKKKPAKKGRPGTKEELRELIIKLYCGSDEAAKLPTPSERKCFAGCRMRHLELAVLDFAQVRRFQAAGECER